MSEESQYSEHPGGWIEWFCQLPQNQYLIEVDQDYIQDPQNHNHLSKQFTYFQRALLMILSQEQPDTLDLENEKFLELYSEASDIFGLIHKNFIQSPKGMAIMKERFLNGRFGHCPRIMCEQQNVIPFGLSDSLKTSRVKIYCPRCKEAYQVRKSQADFDGAYFGRNFPQLLLLTYPEIQPQYTIPLDSQLFTPFEPTLYGFKINSQKQKYEQSQHIELKDKENVKNQENQKEQKFPHEKRNKKNKGK